MPFKRRISIFETYLLSYGNSFKLEKCKILSFDKELKHTKSFYLAIVYDRFKSGIMSGPIRPLPLTPLLLSTFVFPQNFQRSYGRQIFRTVIVR